MAVQPIIIQRQKEVKEKEKDPLDYILQGLQIADTAFGIKSKYDNLETAKLQQENARQELDTNKIKLQEAQRVASLPKADYSTRELDELVGKGSYRIGQIPESGETRTVRDDSGNVRSVLLVNTAPEKERSSKAEKEETRKFELTKQKEKEILERQTKREVAGIKTSASGASGGVKPQKALSGEEVKRLDNVEMGLNAIAGMSESLKSGQNTFSLIGDNDFTIARRNFEEAMGRMQSGGAISKDEEERFKAMAPGPLDTKEIQLKKLQQLKIELERRGENLLNRGRPSAGENGAENLGSSQHQEAAEWARANALSPDPKTAAKAQAILKTPEVQKILQNKTMSIGRK